MKSIRKLSEEFVYNQFEKFASLVYENGEETEFYGVRVLEERENFVRGTLINSTASLYIHYVKACDARAERTLKYLEAFIDAATCRTCKTWGKLSIMRALTNLYDAGLLSKISAERLEKCKASTDYSDFFDKETKTVIGLPSNYLQVALACAALREKIGFDKGNYSKTILETLTVLAQGSADMWMDEAPPYLRFDRYSFLVSSELSDTLMLSGIDFPKCFERNLKIAAKHSLFMANNNGDGWNYGRSLSCHGDGAIAEILSSAISRGLLSEDERALALAYISKITKKILNFWFDRERDSFNIWWDGRSTNSYRQVHRVMQVCLDMGIHLLSTLKNLEIGGIDNEIPDESLIPSPQTWEYDEIKFFSDDKYISEAVVLRYADTLAMLPIIGLGHHTANSAYMPYPAICRSVESAPEGPMPFLVPECKVGDKKYRACQYFSDIDIKKHNDTVEITACGAFADTNEKMPTDSGIPFNVTYKFLGNTITACFSWEHSFDSVTMVTGTHGDGTIIEAFGFSEGKTIFENPNIEDYKNFNVGKTPKSALGAYKFMTPHGFITEAREYTSQNTKQISYKITLNI